MVSLYDVIQYLYPDAAPEMNVQVRDEKITRWGLPSPQPTAGELTDAALPTLKKLKKAEIRARVVSECEALMPVYEMIYCVRARIVDPRLVTLDAIAKKGRDLEARVNAAATEADVLVVAW